MEDPERKETEITLEQLGDINVFGFCEDLGEQLWMLKALGALVQSANSAAWSDDECNEAGGYWQGLKQILDLIADHYETKLDELAGNAWYWDGSIVRIAEACCTAIHNGEYEGRNNALELVRGHISWVGALINKTTNETRREVEVYENLKALEIDLKGRPANE